MGIVVGGLLAMGATVAQREIMRRAGTPPDRLGDGARHRAPPAGRRRRRRCAPTSAHRRRPSTATPCCGSSRWWPRRSARSCRAALETPAVIDRLRVDRPQPGDLRAASSTGSSEIMASQAGADTPGRALARIVNRSIGNQQLGFLMAFLGAQGPGPVRRQPAGRHARGARPAAFRRAEHPGHRGRTCGCRWTSSAPSSRCTRRPTPSSSRRTRGCASTSPAWWPSRSTGWRRLQRPGAPAPAQRAAPPRGGHWLERLMTPAQLETFQRTQALMSLLEGYSNHVMNEAGERLLPGFAPAPRALRAAQRGARAAGAGHPAADRARPEDGAVRRPGSGSWTTVLAARDRAFLNRVWEGPDDAARPWTRSATRRAGSPASTAPDAGRRTERPSRWSSWRPRSSGPRCHAEHVAQIEAVPGVRVVADLARGHWSTTTPRQPSARRASCCAAACRPRCSTTSSAARRGWSGSTRSRPASTASRRRPSASAA